jgi:subtilisin family serine protease
VVIAVVDTGVDLDHPDLVDRLVPGIDVVDGDAVPQDTNGHGTHVAGIAAATADNGIGIAGTAPRARIMPVRVLGTDGTGTDEGIARGIDWAVANGAGVVNLSLGESGVLSRISKGGPLNAAIRNAAARGVVVLAAAGNEGTAKRNYRAGTPTLVVNATNEAGQVAQFSNTGDLRAVAAPGVGILSTAPTEPTALWPNGSRGYERLDGTSMATPIVAGIAALLLGAGIDPALVLDRIAQTADTNGNPQLGAGVVDPVEATS